MKNKEKLQKVQDEENEKNRLRKVKSFWKFAMCPHCEGWGEIFESGPAPNIFGFVPCHACDGTGEWRETLSPESLVKEFKHLGK